MKTVPSSFKERKRYIMIKYDSDWKAEKNDIERLVIQACLQFLGELNMARAGIQFVPDSWSGNTAVLRVGHKYVDETKAALALVKEFNGHKITISSLKVSGSIEGVMK